MNKTLLYISLLGIIALSCLHSAVCSEEESDVSDGSRSHKFGIEEDAGEEADSSRSSRAHMVDNDVARIAENMFDSILNNSRTGFMQALKDLASYLPVNVEYAVTVGKNCNIVKYNKPFYYKIPLIIAAVLIVLGVIFGFFGYRLMQLVLFLIGFLIGFSAVYFVIIGLTHGRSEFWILYVALGVALVVGLLAGFLTICIYPVGIFLAGASIGFLITWFIMGGINVQFFRDHIYVPIIIAVTVAIIIGIFALIVQKWFFIVGTAILGGFIVTWGVDYYIELGSMVYYLLLFAENRSTLKPCWYSWIMMPLFIILAVAGFLIQALLTGRKYDHKKEMRGICCGLCRRKKKDKKSKDVELKTSPHGGPKYEKLKSAEN